jgi:hypothetical protein
MIARYFKKTTKAIGEVQTIARQIQPFIHSRLKATTTTTMVGGVKRQ